MKIEPTKDRLYGNDDNPNKKNENFLYGDKEKEKKKVDEKNKEYKKNQLNEKSWWDGSLVDRPIHRDRDKPEIEWTIENFKKFFQE